MAQSGLNGNKIKNTTNNFFIQLSLSRLIEQGTNELYRHWHHDSKNC